MIGQFKKAYLHRPRERRGGGGGGAFARFLVLNICMNATATGETTDHV